MCCGLRDIRITCSHVYTFSNHSWGCSQVRMFSNRVLRLSKRIRSSEREPNDGQSPARDGQGTAARLSFQKRIRIRSAAFASSSCKHISIRFSLILPSPDYDSDPAQDRACAAESASASANILPRHMFSYTLVANRGSRLRLDPKVGPWPDVPVNGFTR